MSIFKFKAMNENGSSLEGQTEAKNLEDAKVKIKAQNMFPISVKIVEDAINLEEQKETKLAEEKENTNRSFDFKKAIKDYDLDLINNSLESYSHSTILWLDNIIVKIELLKKNDKELVSNSLKTNKLVAEIAENYENEKLNKRHNYLCEWLDFGFDTLSQKILKYKDEAVELKENLEDSDDLETLAKIEKQDYPSFVLVAEHTAKLFNKQMKKIDWFGENQKEVDLLIDLHEDWCKDYFLFHSTEREDFFKKCKDDIISEKVSHQWFKDWTKERELIESKLLQLIKGGLSKKASFESLSKVVEKLDNYKDELKDFYMDFRIANYIKNIDKDRDGFFDLIGAEKEMSNVSEQFHSNLEDLIFLPETIEERLFIARWSKDWFDSRIGEIISVTEKGAISEEIAKETVAEFRELQKTNFEAMIQDKESYAEERERKYAKIQSLMRRMSLELENK